MYCSLPFPELCCDYETGVLLLYLLIISLCQCSLTMTPLSLLVLSTENIHPLLVLLVLLQMCTPAQSDLEIDPL